MADRDFLRLGVGEGEGEIGTGADHADVGAVVQNPISAGVVQRCLRGGRFEGDDPGGG